MNYRDKICKQDYVKMLDGEVQFWIEQNSSIHLIAMDIPYKDPVELTADNAREIGQKLIEMANRLDEIENPKKL